MMQMKPFRLFDLGEVSDGETQQVVLELEASNGMESVGLLDRVVTLWQLVDDRCAPRRRRFLLARSFAPLPEGGIRYLGTVQDVFVWHLFEVLCG